MKRVMLCYPPGDLSKKIKNRYKYSLEDLIPHTMRTCNDLGYIASALRNSGHDIFLKDYKISASSALEFLDDILKYSPDVILLTTSFVNVFEDLKLVRMIKSSNPKIMVVLKSEMFYDSSEELLSNLPLGGVDYLVGSDAAFVMPLLINAHFDAPETVYQVPFITICKNGQFQKTNFQAPHGNISDLTFPARDLMKNEYYYRPDNKQVTATINISKGCSFECINCMQQTLSGCQLFMRSAKSVFEEMYECFLNYGIRNFFFPSDNFTFDEKWVEEFCDLIINSPMKGQVDWIANVNIAKFTEYMAMEMKAAGCSILIMRFDSGSEESLVRMKRGFSVDEIYNSVDIANKNKLKIYGIYTVGLPWETDEHLSATRKMMMRISSDFVSLVLPVPYPDSQTEKIFREENILREPVVSAMGIKIPPLGTKFIEHKKIRKFRKQTLFFYFFNPKYVFRRFVDGVKKPELFKKYYNFLSEMFMNKKI